MPMRINQHVARQANDAISLLIDGVTNYAIYTLDPAGRVAIWTRGAERIKGWSEAEIVGRSAEVFYLPDHVAAGRPASELARAKQLGKIEEESWRVRKDGSRFLAHVTITALYAPSGELHGFGKVVRDISRQRAGEAALAQREMQLASILATVPEAMAVLDEALCIVSFSKTAERLFGHAEADVIGRFAPTLLVAKGETFLPPDDAALPVVGRRTIGVRADGTRFPFELALGEMQGETVRGFTAFMRDLSEREATAARLENLQNELFHVGRVSALGAMGSTLAHELNQPITAVVNYAEAARDLLAGGGGGEMVREALRRTVDEALRAGEIVRQLRSFVARGEVDKQPCDLDVLIRETHAMAAGILREHDIETRLDLMQDMPLVMIERIQIQQVLLNLIRNAAEAMATSPRRVLSIRTVRQAATICVTVADTGPGIAPDIVASLFKAFTSGKAGGMGVGLSICRTILEAHGCRIWAESDAKGATMHFTVPVPEANHGGD